MKRRFVIRPRAEIDLLNHCVYLADHQPHSAIRFRQAAEAAFEAVKRTPRRGTMLNHPRSVGIEVRLIKPKGFKNHLIIYQVTDDSVVVLRVLHGSQDIDAALRP